MYKDFFIILLLPYILCNFYLPQKFSLAEEHVAPGARLRFAVSYWVIAMIIALPVISETVAVFGAVAAVLTVVADYVLRVYFGMRTLRQSEKHVFFVKQILHFIVIAAVAYVLLERIHSSITFWNATYLTKPEIVLRKILQDGFFDEFETGMKWRVLLRWSAVLLIVCKPANKMIALLLEPYKPEKTAQPTNHADKNAGRFIGALERIIIVLLVAVAQYSAIGFVLAAKSIACYPTLNKEPARSEYFLLGTLLSTLSALVLTFVLL